jgi:superfamily II DNA or RNA helicase
MLDDLGATRDPVGVKELQVEIVKARVIRLEDGSFAKPASGKLFVRASPDDSGHSFVDEDLAHMEGVKKDLATLGVHVMDTAGVLRALLAEPVKPDNHWVRIWAAARSVSLEVSAGLFREYLAEPLERSVRVRMASGVMRPIAESFLAGEIIPSHAGRDRDRLIDPVFHGEDERLLRELRAVDRLVWRGDAPVEQWLSEFESSRRAQFVEHVKKTTGTTCSLEKVDVNGTPPPWPLEPIAGMSPEARLEATRQVLARPLPEKWTVEHRTARNYPKLKRTAPELVYLRKEGLLATSFGPLPPSHTLLSGAHPLADPKVLPVYETSAQVAEALGILTSIDDVSEERWGDWKKVADRWDDDVRRSEFYAWLPGRFRPKALVVRVGPRREPVEIQNIGVTSDKAVYASLLEAGIPALWVESQSDVDDQFIGHWEMTDGKDLLQEELVSEPSGEATYLLDAFKPLQNFLQVEDHELKLQYCSRLAKMIATPRGQVAQRLDALRDGDRVLVTATDAPRVLLQVSEVLGLGLTAVDVHRIERQMAETAANELRRRVKRAENDDARLVEAVGTEALRRSVPRGALEFLENTGGAASSQDVARLARAVHGVGILKQLRQALEDNGLEPPREWSGRRVSRDFVTSLGFPVEWAGFPTSSRPSVEIVEGPAVLKPLHDYQEFVTEQIVKLLVGIGKDRGMVSLPTGAGKTRVTVEALVNAQREGRLKDAPLVWIAQSDELCEQAAESWTYVWRAIGPSSPMTLSRLWAQNEVAEEPSAFQVVVTTIDKLQKISLRPGTDYEWIRDPSVVVVDEAHLSVASSYTQVLEWLGRGRSRKEFRPLIGLTATPFRGTSTAETERLVNRYDGNRLDRGAFRDPDDPYRELQEMRVLAQVRQNLLDGVDVHLSPDEVTRIETTHRLPETVTERLGLDQARTLRIVESIASLPPDWTVLLFATSVENSRVLAALLSHRGIPAVSISSETEAAARRHYVEQFKAGKIRVLTNFNVLTQGFDAPAVRAVYVTRPTFSPNVYQQMVGRGLRGPRNGGSEEVLIVNMRDNFNKFGNLLAYRDFEYLWTK